MAKGGNNRRGGDRINWAAAKRENKQWESFYREQNMPIASEFEEFKAACERDLPLTFRITGTSEHAIELRSTMEDKHIKALQDIEWEGERVQAPKPLAFYPDRLGWQVNVSKQVIRKNPQFSELQRFLVVETAVGNVSRQEAVSMIPPLLMDIEPHHFVLDTCASPGSKTAQLIEALHKNAPGEGVKGMVIANDSDYKRSHMLTHQIKRLNSPNVIITNCDAQRFPNLFVDKEHREAPIQFDRILCDVPCSGDATMRKNPNVWRDWAVGNGLGLHTLQYNITHRAVQMLRPGGRLVYSTCSLNPIEDEAVLAHILRNHPYMHLVDVSKRLEGLKRSPGVNSWKVMGKDKEWHEISEVSEKLPRSWFPPAEDESFKLERAIRVYPHQQDTGGFFIAVLEKDVDAPQSKVYSGSAQSAQERPSKRAKVDTSETTPETKPEAEAEAEVEEGAPAVPEVPLKLPRDVPATEDPFKFVAEDHTELDSCYKFYGIKDQSLRKSMLVRNSDGEPTRTIYYVAPSVRSVLEFNDGRIRFINAGIKVFNHQRSEGECRWRVQSEGLQLIRPHASKRVVKTDDLATLKTLLEQEFPKLNEVKEMDEKLYEQVQPMTEGCILWDLQGQVYPLWRGKASLSLMVTKETAGELLLRLFGIDKKKT